MIKENDLDIKKYLGLDKEQNKLNKMQESMTLKRGVSNLSQPSPKLSKKMKSFSVVEEDEADILPTDFAKTVLAKCGYMRPKMENVPTLKKGSCFEKMLERNPSL